MKRTSQIIKLNLNIKLTNYQISNIIISDNIINSENNMNVTDKSKVDKNLL
jgi:hypothetical protein